MLVTLDPEKMADAAVRLVSQSNILGQLSRQLSAGMPSLMPPSVTAHVHSEIRGLKLFGGVLGAMEHNNAQQIAQHAAAVLAADGGHGSIGEMYLAAFANADAHGGARTSLKSSMARVLKANPALARKAVLQRVMKGSTGSKALDDVVDKSIKNGQAFKWFFGPRPGIPGVWPIVPISVPVLIALVAAGVFVQPHTPGTNPPVPPPGAAAGAAAGVAAGNAVAGEGSGASNAAPGPGSSAPSTPPPVNVVDGIDSGAGCAGDSHAANPTNVGIDHPAQDASSSSDHQTAGHSHDKGHSHGSHHGHHHHGHGHHYGHGHHHAHHTKLSATIFQRGSEFVIA